MRFVKAQVWTWSQFENLCGTLLNINESEGPLSLARFINLSGFIARGLQICRVGSREDHFGRSNLGLPLFISKVSAVAWQQNGIATADSGAPSCWCLCLRSCYSSSVNTFIFNCLRPREDKGVRELLPNIGPIPMVIPLKLFLATNCGKFKFQITH